MESTGSPLKITIKLKGMPLVQLKNGDMFNGPSDLIVLPCSTGGTITSLVSERLANHKIPHPKPGMQLGAVSIIPFKGGENIAQFVAYAASVSANSSSEKAIYTIGKHLGRATTNKPSIRLVAAPLLGAGAGNLPKELAIEALSQGFKSSAHHDARLVIHVLQEELFKKLSTTSNESHDSSDIILEAEKAIRVFISYCHTSSAHSDWVKELGTFLRTSGIDARLDIWHLRVGMDLAQFMTNELKMAERVIIISDEKYAEKADGRFGGVGWETMLIQGDMYHLPPESTKYLTVVRSKKVEEGLPNFLKTKFVFHWHGKSTEEKKQQALLKELYNLVKIPALGKKPVFL